MLDTVAVRCRWRRPTNWGCASSRPTWPVMRSRPSSTPATASGVVLHGQPAGVREHTGVGEVEHVFVDTVAQAARAAPVRAAASRRPRTPACERSPGQGRERPASSRADACRAGRAPLRRPACRRGSAWPVFWIGRSVPLALSTGLAGCPSNGPSGAGPRAMLTPWPRSVPPSAIIRYQWSPRRYRCGASGNFRPVPDHKERGSSSALLVGEVDAHLLDAFVLADLLAAGVQAGERDVRGAVVVPGQSGSIPPMPSTVVPSLQGPAGSVAVNATAAARAHGDRDDDVEDAVAVADGGRPHATAGGHIFDADLLRAGGYVADGSSSADRCSGRPAGPAGCSKVEVTR